WRLLQVNVGFKTENLLTMTVFLPLNKYADAPPCIEFDRQLNERLQSLPGVTAAGTVDILPVNGGNTTRFVVEGDPVPPHGQEIEANIRTVNDNYFKTLGVPLIGGRMFDESDNAKSRGVVIINKTIADKFFAGRDPIGRELRIQEKPDLIIGVVGDVKITGLADAIRPVLYYPYRQDAGPVMSVVVRTTSDPVAFANSVRNEIKQLEPGAAFLNVQTMEKMISNTPASFMRRFPALMISIFAGVALLLASIGIYGVISYSVTQQTHYIGIRLALGARPPDILKMVLKEGLVMASVGVAIGVVAAFGLMRVLSDLLFEV